MKTMTVRSAVLRTLLIAAVAAVSFMLSGFAEGDVVSPDNSDITCMLERRTVAMQRYIFGSSKDEQELFSELSDIETYPALSDDYRSSLSSSAADMERIINIKTESVECESRTRSYGIYRVNIKWYMSGYDGYYTENVSYKIRTLIVNGQQRIAEFKVI